MRLPRNHIHGYRSLPGRKARRRIARLVTKLCLNQVLAGLRLHVRTYDKFTGIHAQFFVRFEGEREIFTGRKINRTHGYSGWLRNQQLRRNEALFVRRVRVDVQARIHLEVQLNDAVLIRGDRNLLRIEKRHELLLRLARRVTRFPGQFLRSRKARRQSQNRPSDPQRCSH